MVAPITQNVILPRGNWRILRKVDNTPNDTNQNAKLHKSTLSLFPLPRGERIKVRVNNIPFARSLRKNQTDAERLLWFKLRGRQLDGFKFRRQERIGSYIVDFICFDQKLVVEIDGGQHNEVEGRERDEVRTMWLKSERYFVLRFWNNEVINNLNGVLEKIREALVPHPPTLSP